MRHVPWHVKGVRPEVREVARSAARRCGLSVGAWLNSLIVNAAVHRDAAAPGYLPPAPLDPAAPFQPTCIDDAAFAAIRKGVIESLEQRIDTLVDKLENAKTRSDHREGTDHRVDELLSQLKELRARNENGLAAIQQQLATTVADAISGPAESIRRDVASLKEIQASVDRRTQDTFEAVYGTMEQVVDRLATIEDGLRDRQFAPVADQLAGSSERHGKPVQTSSASAMVLEAPALVPSAAPTVGRVATVPAIEPQDEQDWAAKVSSGILSAHPSATAAWLRQPVVSDFAPDTSIEPGSGAPRVRVVANAIDRTSASQAMNGAAKPAETAAPMRTNFVAAARRAARAAASEHQRTPAAWFERPQNFWQNFRTAARLGTLRPRIKYMVLGISMIVLMLGALHLALDLFHNPAVPELARSVTRTDDVVQPGGETIPSAPEPPPHDQPPTRRGANLESPMLPAPVNANAISDQSTFGPGVVASALMRNPLLQAPDARDAVSQPGAASTASVHDLTEMPLPPTIGGRALIAAASAGDPGASYEVAMRFAQGRNVPQDLAMAAAWFERAARGGLAPAQFRLGSMYEKGLGVKKDLTEARRLYLAAADKGNAKAMHNLAVLYADGLDGKPDYAAASQWFGKAAVHGIVDSQYNLAILYARGVGVERNTAESYKWFALAAKGGDKDAARKRDDIATRLDPKQLESIKLKVESFIAQPQPDAATATKAPAGGWDQVAAASTTKSKASR